MADVLISVRTEIHAAHPVHRLATLKALKGDRVVMIFGGPLPQGGVVNIKPHVVDMAFDGCRYCDGFYDDDGSEAWADMCAAALPINRLVCRCDYHEAMSHTPAVNDNRVRA